MREPGTRHLLAHSRAFVELPAELWAVILQTCTETGAQPKRRWETAPPCKLVVDDLAELIQVLAAAHPAAAQQSADTAGRAWPCLLQVSTVCSKFAEAALLVNSLKLGLDLRGEHYNVDRLDSALLLRWAGHMQGLQLYDETLALPGIAQF